MKATKTINEAIKEGFIPFIYWTNSPTCDILNVKKETEKAILVQHEEAGLDVWIPKSAFEFTKYGAFTLKKWFKSNLNKYQQKALFILI